MLPASAAHNGTDREIAAAAARLLHHPVPSAKFTKDHGAALSLRTIMCPEYSGEIVKEATGTSGSDPSFVHVSHAAAFAYTCRNRRGELVAKGWGATEELAICDAFLRFAFKAQAAESTGKAPDV